MAALSDDEDDGIIRPLADTSRRPTTGTGASPGGNKARSDSIPATVVDDDAVIRVDRSENGGEGPHSPVLDVMATMRDAAVHSFTESARDGNLPTSFDDPNFFGASDRLAVTEALAKAGIAPIESPRGMIELANGLIETEARRRTLDPEVAVKIAQYQKDLALIEASVENSVELKRIVDQQAIAQQTYVGEHDTAVAQMNVEQARLTRELAQLNADVKRKQEETGRQLAGLEDGLRKKAESIRIELSTAKADADKELAEHQQYVKMEAAKIKATRTETDLRRARHRAWVYDKKYLLIAALIALIAVITLVVIIVKQ